MEEKESNGDGIVGKILKYWSLHTSDMYYGSMTQEEFNKYIKECFPLAIITDSNNKETMPKETKERLQKLIDGL